MIGLTLGAVAVMAAMSIVNATADVSWRTKLDQQLPLLGHRNWIVIVDSAYPWQTAPGIETVWTGASQTEVVRAVLDTLDKSAHVRPIIYTDAELTAVPEARAKGVEAYREELAKILTGRKVTILPHEQIISRLDEAGKTFHVLVLKTKMAIPYTSVFLQLDCNYWSAAAERALRESLKGNTNP
jgi:hypothetical protein